jgi:hypothetical protein
MRANELTRAASDGPVEPTLLPQPMRRQILLYVGGLIVVLAFGDPSGGLMDVPVSFFLKNKLHLEAHELAHFRLIAGIPFYLSFAFGLVRDSWSPFGAGDRGLMMLFGVVSLVLYLAFAFVPISYASLLVAIILLTISFLFVSSAQSGLSAALGQQHAMSGQISAVINIFGSFPVIVALLAGGSLSDWLEGVDAKSAAHGLFTVGAAVSVLIVAYAALKPRSVFDHYTFEHGPAAQPVRDLRRLARHGPAYPALAIWLLWNFAPGSTTPLQYYLQNTLQAGDAQWGVWNAIYTASFLPTFLLFGLLCRRVPLKALLWWGTVLAVPQFVPLLFIHSMTGALIAAVPIGLMGGVATAAYLDLIIRSCPPGLQGTMMMMSGGLYYVSTRFGDILGTYLYDFFGGFSVCVLSITIVYASILLVLLFVPDDLVDTADEQLASPEAAAGA